MRREAAGAAVIDALDAPRSSRSCSDRCARCAMIAAGAAVVDTLEAPSHDSNKRQVQEMNRQQDEESEEIGSGGKKQATGEKGAQNGKAFGRRSGKQNP